MAYVVAEPCIKCKYTDCVEVCPVNCFYEGANFLVIHPDECIDCGACEPVCPTKAIFPESDLPEKWSEYKALERRPGQEVAQHQREEGRRCPRPSKFKDQAEQALDARHEPGQVGSPRRLVSNALGRRNADPLRRASSEALEIPTSIPAGLFLARLAPRRSGSVGV